MIKLFTKLTAAAALLIAATVPVQASSDLSEYDRADVRRIETYLNSIKSLKSPFVQLVSGGGYSEGTLYIERPDRLRLDYEKPATTQVYANGDWLVYVDTELENVTHVPISSTVAGFLVRDKIRFGGDIAVRRVMRSDKTITLELVRADEPEQGSFAVTFANNPLQLRRWTVVDAQGVTTNVTLVGPEFNVAIPREIFVFDESRFDREMP